MHAGFLRRFNAAKAHDADGYGSSSAWLTARAGMSKKAARAAVRQMRQLGDRPLLATALTGGDITDSLAFAIADWPRKLPGEMREETDRILLDAASAGASLDDLATIAACAIERWRQQRPHPDDPDDGFDDRYVEASTTFGGAGVIRGSLTRSAPPRYWRRWARRQTPKTTAPRASGSTTPCSWPVRCCPVPVLQSGPR
jgi:hypothetical protein